MLPIDGSVFSTLSYESSYESEFIPQGFAIVSRVIFHKFI